MDSDSNEGFREKFKIRYCCVCALIFVIIAVGVGLLNDHKMSYIFIALSLAAIVMEFILHFEICQKLFRQLRRAWRAVGMMLHLLTPPDEILEQQPREDDTLQDVSSPATSPRDSTTDDPNVPDFPLCELPKRDPTGDGGGEHIKASHGNHSISSPEVTTSPDETDKNINRYPLARVHPPLLRAGSSTETYYPQTSDTTSPESFGIEFSPHLAGSSARQFSVLYTKHPVTTATGADGQPPSSMSPLVRAVCSYGSVLQSQLTDVGDKVKTSSTTVSSSTGDCRSFVKLESDVAETISPANLEPIATNATSSLQLTPHAAPGSVGCVDTYLPDYSEENTTAVDPKMSIPARGTTHLSTLSPESRDDLYSPDDATEETQTPTDIEQSEGTSDLTSPHMLSTAQEGREYTISSDGSSQTPKDSGISESTAQTLQRSTDPMLTSGHAGGGIPGSYDLDIGKETSV